MFVFSNVSVTEYMSNFITDTNCLLLFEQLKSKRLWWAGCVALMRKTNACPIFVGKPFGNYAFKRAMIRWGNSIKISPIQNVLGDAN